MKYNDDQVFENISVFKNIQDENESDLLIRKSPRNKIDRNIVHNNHNLP